VIGTAKGDEEDESFRLSLKKENWAPNILAKQGLPLSSKRLQPPPSTRLLSEMTRRGSIREGPILWTVVGRGVRPSSI